MADLKQIETELKKKNLGGFWEIFHGETYKEPHSVLEACLWKWSDLSEGLAKAATGVDVDTNSRRAIRLLNPSSPTRTTTNTLAVAVQLVKPGEHAPAHRHTQAAIRFVIQGKGAHCVVGGESFPIGPGDFLTTPTWVWHDHVNDSNEDLVFLDCLDNPLVRMLEIGFHEPYPGGKQPVSKPQGASRLELGAVRPNWVQSGPRSYRSYLYAWEDTETTLKSLVESPGDPYDGILLDYINPLNGGPTLPTLACGIQMLRPGEKTKAHRHTDTCIYHVFKGEGSTVVGETTLDWKQGDVFVVPLWCLHRHENHSDSESIFFVASDRPMMEALGYYRQDLPEQ